MTPFVRVPFRAVVLAGGKGTRLAPYTLVLPKPLLPIGERPILDLVLSQLAGAGCARATLCVGYLAPLIEAYCRDGERWGLALDYFRESVPLGTAGALGHIADLPAEGFLLMNGDVLTDLAYPRLLAAHAASGADLTIAAFRRIVKDELGVLEIDDDQRVTAYREKPEHEYLVSMGIYVLSLGAAQRVRAGERLDFPDLVQRLLAEGRKVAVYIHEGYWLDIGRHDDFARANEESRDRKDER
ncbi:MAG: sugar phosphate nucleotidyltransferase [Vicinamibacteria bacterium]